MQRLVETDSGKIEFKGHDINHASRAKLRPLRHRFQMIFQDPMSSLNPRRRVGGIIAGPLHLQGMSDLPARVAEALDMVGMPRHFAQRYPHELSGGQH